jgi:iron complex outermembrane receptor protein
MKNRLLVSILIVLVGASLSLAEEDEKAGKSSAVRLTPVIVTGTRVEQQVQSIPANVSVITPEDIRNTNAKTAADLLRSQEGIVVRDLLGNGNSSQVDLRGFGETANSNTLVMVDGRRVNEIDLSSLNWAQIPIGQIERIEVVRGSGTVLYGDNATAGVINIITKAPPRELTAEGGLALGSYDRYKVDAYAGGSYGAAGLSLYGSHEDTDGYRKNNDYQSDDVSGKLVLDATDTLSLNFSGSYHEDQFGLPGTLTQDELKDDRKQSLDPKDEAKTHDGYISGGIEMDFGGYGRFAADTSYRKRTSKSKFPDPDFPFKNDVETETVGFTPRYIWDGSLFERGNRLVAGVDLYSADQDNKSFSGFFSPLPSSPTGISRVDRDTVGVYLNDEFYLLDNLLVTLGGRYEHVRYDFDVKDLSAFPLAPLKKTTNESKPAFVAGLTWLYGEESSAYARVNSSFRFPLIDELVVFDFDTGQIVVNPDLDPQSGITYEVGLRHHFTPRIQAGLTLYRTETDDEIFFNRPTFTNENYPETLRQGVEVGGRVELTRHLAVTANYTYQQATFERGDYKNKDVPAAPRHLANFGLRVDDFLPGFDFSIDGNYVGSSYAISDFENDFQKLEDFFTLDLRLFYEWRMLRAYAGVNNVLEEEYSEFAVVGGAPLETNFYPAPERNYVFGIKAVF